MNNDRGVVWQFHYVLTDGLEQVSELFDSAEAARKAADVVRRTTSLKPNSIRMYKIDPVHGPVEIMP